MTFISGVLCDGCGKADIAQDNPSSPSGMPRRSWASVTIWTGESYGVASDNDLHACSAECLKTVAEKLIASVESNTEE